MSDPKILLVEDSRIPGNTCSGALQQLRAAKYSLTRASSLAEGIVHVAQTRFAAALVDLSLPQNGGLPAFLRFQSKAGTIPIVVIVDRVDEDNGIEAVRRGALDYLVREDLTAPLIDKVLRLALERTHTVLALRASEARYRTMFESTAAGVYQATCDDRLISVNPAFVAMLGYESEDQLLSMDFGSRIVANHEDHLLWRQQLEEAGEIRGREMSLRNRAGERMTVLHSARLVRDSRGLPLYYEGTVADITASHRQASQWSYEANHDGLTGLLNRRELERRLQVAFDDARIDRSSLAILMIDLDSFKSTNDRFGHAAGDDLLRHVASVLRRSARAGDLIARYGGDEFVLILEHCAEEDAQRVADTILERLRSEECLWAGQTLQASASIGIAVESARNVEPAALLERADRACYDAKNRGGNRVRVYSHDCTVNIRIGRSRQFALSIEHALSNGELSLLAQRIAPLRDRGARSHFEIAIAMADSHGEPAVLDTTQLADEHAVLAHRLDAWCLRAAFQWVARHQHGNPDVERWFVNLSRTSLLDPELPRFIGALLREQRVPAERIGLEIEEQALATGFVQISELVQQLAPSGIAFSLDGFGRGISSFAYLKSLALGFVKIDHAALAQGTDPKAAEALLRSLHQINRALERKTVVQAVADKSQLRDLVTVGIDYAQGPAVAAPVALQVTRAHSKSSVAR